MGWGSAAKLGRPYDRHIDNEELNALVPSSSEIGHEQHGLSPDALRDHARTSLQLRLDSVIPLGQRFVGL